MTRVLLRHLRRNTVAYLALLIALSSTSYAAASKLLPANTVGSRQVVNGSLQQADLNKKTVAALRGKRGLRGVPGATGSDGSTGPRGATGPQGAPGPGSGGVFSSDGSHPALRGIIDVPSPSATAAIEGVAPRRNTNGVYGYGSAGVWGNGDSVGVQGDGGLWGISGFGSRLGVLSRSDLGIEDHLYTRVSGKLAGICSMPAAQTSVRCSFNTAFGPQASPIVVLTPTANPGGPFWISGVDNGGFTLNVAVAPAGSILFDYLVVGVDACPFPGSSC
jgi:hypothetical protein